MFLHVIYVLVRYSAAKIMITVLSLFLSIYWLATSRTATHKVHYAIREGRSPGCSQAHVISHHHLWWIRLHCKPIERGCCLFDHSALMGAQQVGPGKQLSAVGAAGLWRMPAGDGPGGVGGGPQTPKVAVAR